MTGDSTGNQPVEGAGTIAPQSKAIRDFVEAGNPRKPLVLRIDNGGITDAFHINEDVAKVAFGTDDHGFIHGAFDQLTQLAALDGKINDDSLKFMASAMVGLAPKTTAEALLSTQIVAGHVCMMKLARMLATASTIERTQAVGNLYAKAARASAAQIEALHRLRHGGQQKVTVEHVNVAEGGQAVFGIIDTGGRG